MIVYLTNGLLVLAATLQYILLAAIMFLNFTPDSKFIGVIVSKTYFILIRHFEKNLKSKTHK